MEKHFVNYNQALALKELGFDEPCTVVVTKENTHHLVSGVEHTIINGMTYITTINSRLPDTICSAPTITEVVMWLYEKHGLFIHLSYVCWSHLNKDAFTPHIAKVLSDNGQSDAIRIMLANYDSPTKAYEAAIEHILQNLI